MKCIFKFFLYSYLVLLLSGCSNVQFTMPTGTITPSPANLPTSIYINQASYTPTLKPTNIASLAPTSTLTPTPTRNIYFVDAINGSDNNHG